MFCLEYLVESWVCFFVFLNFRKSEGSVQAFKITTLECPKSVHLLDPYTVGPVGWSIGRSWDGPDLHKETSVRIHEVGNLENL